MESYYRKELNEVHEEIEHLLEIAQTIKPPTNNEEVKESLAPFLIVFARMLLLCEGAKIRRMSLNPVVSGFVAKQCTKLDFPAMRRVKKIMLKADKAYRDMGFDMTDFVLSLPMAGGKEVYEQDVASVREIFNSAYNRDPTQGEFLATKIEDVADKIKRGELVLFE